MISGVFAFIIAGFLILFASLVFEIVAAARRIISPQEESPPEPPDKAANDD